MYVRGRKYVMALRVVVGIIGITGLSLGVWMLGYESRTHNDRLSRREHFYAWMLTLDSFMPAFGWATWMGVFGAFVGYSITGQAIV
jgi:hypothetical protein